MGTLHDNHVKRQPSSKSCHERHGRQRKKLNFFLDGNLVIVKILKRHREFCEEVKVNFVQSSLFLQDKAPKGKSTLFDDVFKIVGFSHFG